jgi:hypothetical protein
VILLMFTMLAKLQLLESVIDLMDICLKRVVRVYISYDVYGSTYFLYRQSV